MRTNLGRSIGVWHARCAVLLTLLLAACGDGVTDEGTPDAGTMESDGGEPPCHELGCACDATAACAASLTCDARTNTCRAPLGCAELSCAVHRSCEEVAGGDARCTDCEPGYRWDDVQGVCALLPGCNDALPGSLVQTCALDNRACDDSTGEATCGECLPGTTQVEGKCSAADCSALICPVARTCEQGADGASCSGCATGYEENAAGRCVKQCPLSCRSDERCAEATETEDARCIPRVTCEDGLVDNGRGVCVACNHCYREANGARALLPGVTGHQELAYGDKCVCNLKEGWFQSVLGEVLRCDEDGDGFQNRRSTVLGGTPFEDAARCAASRKVIDRFTLESDDLVPDSAPEVARARDVTVKQLVDTFDIPPAAYELRSVAGQEVVVMALIEGEELDEAREFEGRYTDPNSAFPLKPYGAGTATFRPEHANPLTKVCNQDNDDFNVDGLPDAEQAQGMRRVASRPPQLAGFLGMSYFVELAQGHFEPGSGGIGRYVIRERARLGTGDAPLPLPLDTGSAAGVYETQCMRSRDSDYPGRPSATAPAVPGFDFALWQCTKASGSCLGGDEPSHVPYDGRRPSYADALESYASAENGGTPVRWNVPAEQHEGQTRWPGMNHHSQFKCVTASASAVWSRRTDGLDASRTWDRYACSLRTTGQAQGQPDWKCEPRSEPPTGNHWAVARHESYTTPGSYERGCIEEGVEWEFACPAWEARWGADRATFQTEPLRSGRFACESGCERQGHFMSTNGGGVCCYGEEDTQCSYENFLSDEGSELLCSLPGSGPALESTPACSEALGEFVWAAEQGGQYDPNVLKWADVTGPSRQYTSWEP